MNRTRHAFTLIELLTVIAVVSIIAAIVFPVFAGAREKGRQITCTSNLKQLGVAFLAYSTDNDERFPLPGAADEYDMDQHGPFWDKADPSEGGPINAYVRARSSDLRGGPSVWFCPDLSGYHENDLDPYSAGATFKQCTVRTYSMNWYLRDLAPDKNGVMTDPDSIGDPNPATAADLYQKFGTLKNTLSVSRLVAPSDTVLLFEGACVEGATYLGPSRRSGDWAFQKGYMGAGLDVYAGESINTAAHDGAKAWHNGVNNTLFCDGHVRSAAMKGYPFVPTPTDNAWYVAKWR